MVINQIKFLGDLKMKKIILVFALLLCVVFACTSCGSDMSPADLYKNEAFEETPTLTTATSISALRDFNYKNKSLNYLLLFTDEEGDYYKVYNIETGSVILSFDTEDTEVELFSVKGIPFIQVVKSGEDEEDKDITTIYDANGMTIASASDYDAIYVDIAADLIEFDNVIYRVDAEGFAEELCDSTFFDLPSIDFMTENHYFCIDEEEFSVYDNELNLVYFWENVNDNAEEIKINVLSDKTVLVQFFENIPQDTVEFDVFTDGTKYNLASIVINVKNGKEKNVDLDYVVKGVYYIADEIGSYGYEQFEYPKSIDVIASIVYIENQTILGQEVIVTLKTGNAKIDKTIAAEYDSYIRIAEDLWILTYKNGDKVLADDKGDVIAKFDDYSKFTGRYIIANGKIYDFELTELYNLKANDMTVSATLANNIILSDDEGEKFLFTGSSSLTSIDDFHSYEGQYYVTEDDGEYTFYNEEGARITSQDLTEFKKIYTNRDASTIIFQFVDDESEISYYAFN